MKRLACVLLSLAMAATMLTGCGNQSGKEDAAVGNVQTQEEKEESEKEKVVVACWGNQMLDSYTQYLCDLFPEVEFEFVLATNSTDYYRFRQDHDDMPDILTVRRFALKDAVLLKDYLYDLSNTELASTYYGSYLDSYTYDDGSVNWLPTCAEVDGIIINKTLFDEYRYPFPQTTRASSLLAKPLRRWVFAASFQTFLRTIPVWRFCRELRSPCFRA